MISHEVSFDDEVSGQGVSVFVKASYAHYFDESKKDSNGLRLCLQGASGWDYTDAYIPRKQAKKIIKAMKAVLNDQ